MLPVSGHYRPQRALQASQPGFQDDSPSSPHSCSQPHRTELRAVSLGKEANCRTLGLGLWTAPCWAALCPLTQGPAPRVCTSESSPWSPATPSLLVVPAQPSRCPSRMAPSGSHPMPLPGLHLPVSERPSTRASHRPASFSLERALSPPLEFLSVQPAGPRS